MCGWEVGKFCFIKDDVTGHNDFASVKIETPISLLFERVPNKNTSGGPWSKFVRASGVEVGETQASENAKMIVSGLNAGEK
mgnify:CR=1 FL=1